MQYIHMCCAHRPSELQQRDKQMVRQRARDRGWDRKQETEGEPESERQRTRDRRRVWEQETKDKTENERQRESLRARNRGWDWEQETVGEAENKRRPSHRERRKETDEQLFFSNVNDHMQANIKLSFTIYTHCHAVCRQADIQNTNSLHAVTNSSFKVCKLCTTRDQTLGNPYLSLKMPLMTEVKQIQTVPVYK